MFADVDESIRQLLVQRGHLNSGEIDVSFDMPTRDWAAGIAKPTVNVYLYDVRENLQFRNPAPWNVRNGPNNTAIKSKPSVSMDLSYRVTAFANAVEDEHRLLTRVLVTLLQHPTLPEEVLQGQAAGQEIQTFTAQPSEIVQSPADYWGALDNDIKPCIDFKVTVKVDLAQEISVGLALTSQFKVGQIDPNGKTPALDELPLQIGGRVHQRNDKEAGIGGASVTLVERALDAVTDAEGRYTFRGLPPGDYTLAVAAPGKQERRVQLRVPGGSYDVGV